ncbi:unnamed protein product [Staurois parvus]|uniref:Uncharacterized protein n=1 Tax=Staurois parvus TaxID=386267 RepID=A0ABN9B658_9NEOB|nr:unnamed protein product [Staurois parvus]
MWCPPQPVSPAVLDSRRPASSVWAPGCDSFQTHHSQVPTAHARVALGFMNGPVVFWDLSRVPKHYREGRRTPYASNCLGDRTRSGSRYLSNSGTRSPLALQRCQSLMGSGGSSP